MELKLKLKVSKQAGRFVEELQAKQYKQVVGTVLDLLKNPEPHDSKLLKGSVDRNRRVDIGEYRITYRLEGDMVLVLVIGKRNDDEVYKILDRMR